MEKDNINYLEIARIAMLSIPEHIVEQMDMSDGEFIRLRDQIIGAMAAEPRVYGNDRRTSNLNK